ncbi:MAG: GNAT family N-acetyltransferase [Solirubrobacteraceae bacterium]
MSTGVTDNPDASRYELTVDGTQAGFVTYRLRPGVITLLHAEVDPDREGQGLGSKMVVEMLDQIRARGLAVRPVCPFVAAYIESHPEYADLVA